MTDDGCHDMHRGEGAEREGRYSAIWTGSRSVWLPCPERCACGHQWSEHAAERGCVTQPDLCPCASTKESP